MMFERMNGCVKKRGTPSTKTLVETLMENIANNIAWHGKEKYGDVPSNLPVGWVKQWTEVYRVWMINPPILRWDAKPGDTEQKRNPGRKFRQEWNDMEATTIIMQVEGQARYYRKKKNRITRAMVKKLVETFEHNINRELQIVANDPRPRPEMYNVTIW